MSESSNEMIINELKKDALKELMFRNQRIDDRGRFDYRPIVLEKNILENSEGSALCRLGKTQVLASVKFDIATPFPDKPEDGIVMTSAELLPFANENFETGPPSENSIELARVVDRAIRSSEIIDTSKLFIEEGKVLAVFIDLYILDHNGNLFDASSLAAMEALLNTRMPKIEDAQIIREESTGNLPLKGKVVSCTFGKIEDMLLLDPALDEEMGLDSMLTIGFYNDLIVSMQKTKNGAIFRNDIEKMLDIGLEKSKELIKLL